MADENRKSFDLALVGQSGRIGVEAALLVASLRRADPGFSGRVIVMEPQPGPLWPDDPRVGPEARAALERLGAQIAPFESRRFGAAYPHGNKIEGLAQVASGPTLFLDSDTIVTGALSDMPLSQPAASMKRTNTWPKERLGGPGPVWRALYERFGVDIAPTLDAACPPEDWRHWLYLNAGWVALPDPKVARTWERIAADIWAAPGPALDGQALTPWLDQIALPLALAAHGGGRPGSELSGLDGDAAYHWRTLPLLYARGPDAVIEMLETLARLPWLKKALRTEDAFRRFVYRGKGAEARAMFGAEAADMPEADIRKALKAAGLWIR